MTRILVVDDEPTILDSVGFTLEREGFEVLSARDGSEALKLARERAPDVVVLDVMLPGLSGREVCRQLRAESDVPILMLSARAGEVDRVLGLELGADDYVVKPFSPRELASRVRAVLRRVRDEDRTRVTFGELTLDTARRAVHKRGESIALRAKEFDLLAFLVAAPRRVFSREELLEQVWRSMPGWQDLATVTEHVRRVRVKLEDDQEHPRWIRTVRGVGYVFEP